VSRIGCGLGGQAFVEPNVFVEAPRLHLGGQSVADLSALDGNGLLDWICLRPGRHPTGQFSSTKAQGQFEIPNRHDVFLRLRGLLDRLLVLLEVPEDLLRERAVPRFEPRFDGLRV